MQTWVQTQGVRQLGMEFWHSRARSPATGPSLLGTSFRTGVPSVAEWWSKPYMPPPDNIDLLQNIEFKICQVYRSDSSLLDIDVKDAIDALVRHYHAEEEQRRPPTVPLSERAQSVFDNVRSACEWRLGRELSGGETVEEALPVSELLRGLRTIQKSIPNWSKRGGRQGYLDFIIEYLP